MPQEKKHYREIDILKGLAIAMVLLGHAIIEFPINLNTIPGCRFLHLFVSSAHMPLFFAVSGFCFSFREWGGYLRKKSKRILIPFAVFSLTGIAAKALMSELVNHKAPLGDALLSVLTGGTHWFLYTLFVIFLFFPLVRRCFDTAGGGVIFVTAVCALQLFSFWPKLFNLANIVKYTFYFSLGYYMKRLADRSPALAAKLLNLAGRPLTMLISTAAWALFVLGKLRLTDAPFVLQSIVSIAAALSGIAAVIGLSMRIARFRVSGLFELAGKDSLQLYLFNGYLLTLTRALVVTKLHIQNPVVIIASNFLVMFFVSLAFTELVVKRVKAFRILTGMV